MKPTTKKLHLTVIRLLKGVLSAWQMWVIEQPTLGSSVPVSSVSASATINDGAPISQLESGGN